MNGQKVRTNGIETYCVIEGDGPWLVLSHSLACDHSMWEEQMGALTRSFRVLNYDTRGHGSSSAPPGPYSLELLAQDLKGLFDALRIERAHFVGLSMGGMIGQTFALRHQERLASLVLCDTTSSYSPSVRPAWAERIEKARTDGMQALVTSTLERWFTPKFRTERPEVMERFGSRIAATPIEGYIGCSEALLEINVTERLKSIRLPSLVMVGAYDQGTPVSMATVIHENLQGSELIILDDAAHFPNIEQTNAFNRSLLTFLKARTQAARVRSGE